MKPQTHSYEDKLLEFAYGELPADEARSLESHLKGCSKCSEALDAIRGVRRAMAQLPAEAPPEDGLESLLAYADQAARRSALGPPPKNTLWRRWLVPVFGAASLVVVGVIGLRVTEQSEAPTAAEGVKVEKTVAKPQAPLASSGVEGGAAASEGFAGAERDRKDAPARDKAKFEMKRRSPAVRMEEKARREVVAEKPAPPVAQPPMEAEVADEEQADAVDMRYAQNTMNDAPTAQRPLPAKGLSTRYSPKTDAPSSNSTAEPTPIVAGAAKDRGSLGLGTSGGGGSTSYRGRGLETAAPSAAPSSKKASVPLDDGDAAGESRVVSFSAQAEAARARGDRASEISFLRNAIAAGASGATLSNLLSRLCDAQLEVRAGSDACTTLIAQFPRSSAAQLAERRMKAATMKSGEPAKAEPSSAPTR